MLINVRLMSSGRSNLNHAATLLGSKLTLTTQKMDLGIIKSLICEST